MSLEYFERTDELSGQAYSIAGTSGFAYSGGAHSGPQSVSKSCNQDCESSEPHCHGSERRDPTPRISVQQTSPKIEVQCTDSQKHSPSLSDPSDHTAYKPSDEHLPALITSLSPNSPLPCWNVPSMESLRSTPHSVAQIPDTYIPIQEESEDRQPPFNHKLEVRDPRRERHVVSPSTPSSNPSQQTTIATLTLHILAWARLFHLLLTATQQPFPLLLHLSSQARATQRARSPFFHLIAPYRALTHHIHFHLHIYVAGVLAQTMETWFFRR
jgi:hypothetical protein